MIFIIVCVAVAVFLLADGLSGRPDPVTTFFFPLEDEDD